MDDKSYVTAELPIPDAIHELITQLLLQGAEPAEISYHLTTHALNLGFQLAPSLCEALSVITSALNHSIGHYASEAAKRRPESLVEDSLLEDDSAKPPVITLEDKTRTLH